MFQLVHDFLGVVSVLGLFKELLGLCLQFIPGCSNRERRTLPGTTGFSKIVCIFWAASSTFLASSGVISLVPFVPDACGSWFKMTLASGTSSAILFLTAS